jgi:cytochrome c-type biogenesis protein CcmF
VEAFTGDKISVGPPWFEIAFALPMFPLIFLLGAGMHSAWRHQPASGLWRTLKWPALLALVAGIAVPGLIYGRAGGLVAVGTMAAFWILGSSLVQPLRSWRRAPGTPGIGRAMTGMSIAHFGVGLFVLGVAVVSAFGVEEDVKLSPGQSVEVAGYEFRLRALTNVEGPNFRAQEGEVEIRKAGEYVATVRPQDRTYLVRQNPMTEAGIDAGWNRDLFAALGQPLGNGVWSLRVQYKPLIRFIWLGALLMAIGGVVAASDRRYRVNAAARERRPRLAEKPA